MTIDDLLLALAKAGGSDLHIKANRPPLIRLDGDIRPFDLPPLSAEAIDELLFPIMPVKDKNRFDTSNEADFSHLLPKVARFRVNMFRQRGNTGAVFRRIPLEVPTIESLGLPPTLNKLADHENGLVLVTGPTGSGKSTTLAAMIEHINVSRPVHILTIEDPMEFVYEDKLAAINQRELGQDTENAVSALRAAMRQDPDIILMGEMRDLETVRFALTAAETGHLVFATLHTNDAPQTVERILDIMPADMRDALRSQLALLLRGIICQRLVRRCDRAGRTAALEIMVANETVRQFIIEGKLKTIHKAMQDGAYYGMQTFNQALKRLVEEGIISQSTALESSDNPDDLRLTLRGVVKGSGLPTMEEMAKSDQEKQKQAKEAKW